MHSDEVEVRLPGNEGWLQRLDMPPDILKHGWSHDADRGRQEAVAEWRKLLWRRILVDVLVS